MIRLNKIFRYDTTTTASACTAIPSPHSTLLYSFLYRSPVPGPTELPLLREAYTSPSCFPPTTYIVSGIGDLTGLAGAPRIGNRFFNDTLLQKYTLNIIHTAYYNIQHTVQFIYKYIILIQTVHKLRYPRPDGWLTHGLTLHDAKPTLNYYLCNCSVLPQR